MYLEGNDEWYQIRVDFDTDVDTFDIYCNGKLINTSSYFAYPRITINSFGFCTGISEYGYSWYIDAIGLSWDSSYTIENNLDEGLEIGMDLDFIPSSLGYSLDGGSIISIRDKANFTIPIPENCCEDSSISTVSSALVRIIAPFSTADAIGKNGSITSIL